MKRKRLTAIDACSDDYCPHYGRSIQNRPLCLKKMKEIPNIADIPADDTDSNFPSWCPLEKYQYLSSAYVRIHRSMLPNSVEYLDPIVKRAIPGMTIKSELPRRINPNYKEKKRFVIRSRKEKPPRSATKVMRVGSGGNPVAAGLVILLAILTVIMCIIGLLYSMR